MMPATQDNVLSPNQYNQAFNFDGSHFVEGVNQITPIIRRRAGG